MYCVKCGALNDEAAKFCTSCGCGFQSGMENGSTNFVGYRVPVILSRRSKIATVILAIFFGGLGLHRFYIGHGGMGFFYLLMTIVGVFFGLLDTVLGIFVFLIIDTLVFLDIVRILMDSIKDESGLILR